MQSAPTNHPAPTIQRTTTNHLAPTTQLAPADHQSNEASNIESTIEVGQEPTNSSASTCQNSVISQAFMGRDVPINTKRAIKTALKALFTYVILEKNKDLTEENKIGLDESEEAGRKILFPCGDIYLNGGFIEWSYVTSGSSSSNLWSIINAARVGNP